MIVPRIVLFCCTLTFFIHSAKAEYNQPVDKILQDLSNPVNTSAEGFSNFLRYSYNQPEYAQDFLPNNFFHVAQFLEHGKTTKQTRAYSQSVLRLFANKLKGSSYVNALALSDLLDQMPQLLEHHFLVQRKGAELHFLQEKINQLLYARFLDKFAEFKSSPTAFFNDLSQEIVEALSASTMDMGDISIEELRKTMLVFCEVALGKLIWSPEDQIDTWKSVKKISQQLTALMDCNILADADDLNDLFVTLIERYCFFIDIAGDALSLDFYKNLKDDMQTSTLLLFELAEQEEFIERKAQRLTRAIDTAKKRSIKSMVNQVTKT
jgi:hypothetical protein